jgi:hypothetical protein
MSDACWPNATRAPAIRSRECPMYSVRAIVLRNIRRDVVSDRPDREPSGLRPEPNVVPTLSRRAAPN